MTRHDEACRSPADYYWDVAIWWEEKSGTLCQAGMHLPYSGESALKAARRVGEARGCPSDLRWTRVSVELRRRPR